MVIACADAAHFRLSVPPRSPLPRGGCIDIANFILMMHAFRFAGRGISETWECGPASRHEANSATAPATVSGELSSRMPLGFFSSLGRRNGASTRKSGDRPEQSSIRRAVRAVGAVLRCDDDQ